MSTKILELPKLISVKHIVEPLWADDAGRNANSGRYSGTFIGYFDKLEISIGNTTQEEMAQIKSIIENPIIEDLEFIDSNSGNSKTEDFYGTAISALLTHVGGLYKPFTFNLVAIEKRS